MRMRVLARALTIVIASLAISGCLEQDSAPGQTVAVSGNAAPNAGADHALTVANAGVAVSVLANDTDRDGDTLAVESFTQGRRGSVTRQPGEVLLYVPERDFTGTDTFSYKVRDPLAVSAEATVTIEVRVPDNPPLPAGPDWASRIPPGSWAPISGNTLADVDPELDPAVNPNYPREAPWRGSTGQSSVIEAWNGGVIVPNLGTAGSLLLFGGGHGNYFGNEVYRFDLASGRWSRLSDPYVATRAELTAYYELGEFPDGSPLPPHTYDQLEYDPDTRSLIVLRGVQQLNTPGNPVSGGHPHLFDLDRRQWRRGARHGFAVPSGGFSAYDSVRRVHWSAAPGRQGAGLRYFDAMPRNSDGSVGRWSGEIASIEMSGDGAAAFDPLHELLVYTRFRTSGDVMAVHVGEGGPRAGTLLQGGAAPVPEPGHGWEWSPTRRAFLFWRRGAEVHEFRLEGTDPWQDRWEWHRLSLAGAAGPPEMIRDNGIYGRFRLVTVGEREFALVVNGVDQAVYAYRVPPR
jgi:hypothetical protein